MRLPGRSSSLIASLGLLLGAAALFGAGQAAPPAAKAAATTPAKPKSIDGIWPREVMTSTGS